MVQPAPRELGQYRDWLLASVEQIATKYQAKFDASDIVQETLVEAHAHLAEFRGSTEAELTSWLRRMLSRNLIDAVRRLRSRKRDIANEFRLHFAGRGSRQGKSLSLPGEQTSPSGKVVWNEELQNMHAAIDRLPPAQAEAVRLHHLEGLKLTEVAVRMNRTTAAVAGLLHRGLRTLQQRMGEVP